MPLPPDVVPLVREFANNSFRYLFRQVDNVADLLHWREPKIARGIDFTQMAVQPETFIAPTFAQLESDVILRAPFRVRRGRNGSIEIFILIEHQSEPDELMVFRVIRYVVLIYERQATEWLQTHPNLRKFRFSPVLPVVF
jgi:predicted transposase/invertase (TIGR01784 family)